MTSGSCCDDDEATLPPRRGAAQGATTRLRGGKPTSPGGNPPLPRGPQTRNDETVPGTVLIVDDHERFRSMARRALQSDGWTVVGEAADGASGLTAASDLGPDLVVLDVGLPDISGLEVAPRLGEAQPTARVASFRRRSSPGAPSRTFSPGSVFP